MAGSAAHRRRRSRRARPRAKSCCHGPARRRQEHARRALRGRGLPPAQSRRGRRHAARARCRRSSAHAARGRPRFVLDNTYLSRKSRAPVIAAARGLGLPARCVHLATSLEDAQINAVTRLIARHGRLLADEELRRAASRRCRRLRSGRAVPHAARARAARRLRKVSRASRPCRSSGVVRRRT